MDKERQKGTQSSKDDNQIAIVISAYAALFMLDSWKDKKGTWIADSGASSHMTPSKSILHDFNKFIKPVELITAGSKRYAIGEGTVRFEEKGKQLEHVLCVPNIPTNLLS